MYPQLSMYMVSPVNASIYRGFLCQFPIQSNYPMIWLTLRFTIFLE